MIEDTGTTETTATPVESTAPVAMPMAPDTGTTSADGTPTEAIPYAPDYKFSAYGEEGEIEENFRQYIKDKASEDTFKKLYSKAHAFEKAHEKLERTRGEYQKTNSELKEYTTGINELRSHVKNKDFESFFKRLNIPISSVWEWVNDKVNYQELSPEQKMQYDEAARLKRENFETQNQLKSKDEAHDHTMSRLANLELDYAMSKPDIRELQEAYDAKKGRRGAFRDFVIDRGAAIESRSRKDCSAEDAIKDAIEWLDMGTNQEAQQGQPLVARSSNKPVIPNIRGGGVAPVKKRPQNLKELREDIARRQSARP